LISSEIRDIQKNVITKKEEPLATSFTEGNLKGLLYSQISIQKSWELDLPAGAEYIYVSITDNVKGKTLRKLLRAPEN